MLLKTLCETHGVSGDEGHVRDILLEAVRPYADRITVDVMGNLIVYKKGASADKTVMLCAHMDEVGLIVSAVTDNGYLKFKTVGGIDARYWLGSASWSGPIMWLELFRLRRFIYRQRTSVRRR